MMTGDTINRIRYFLSVCIAVILQSGCVNESRMGKNSGPLLKDATIRAASCFGQKFERICLDEDLDIDYLGPLAHKWHAGLQPASAEDYNAWCVRLFCTPGSKGSEPERFLPDDPNMKGFTKDAIERHLFYLRIGHFRSGKNIIPVKMGPFEFDILVFEIEGGRGIDETIPALGTTVREFVKRVEKPSPLDRELWNYGDRYLELWGQIP